MGEIVPIGGKRLTPGQDLFAAIVDSLAADELALPRSTIAVAVKHGVAALRDGVDPQSVLAGCLAALLQNKGRYAADYITDMALLRAGKHMSREEYNERLRDYKHDGQESLHEIVQRMADHE